MSTEKIEYNHDEVVYQEYYEIDLRELLLKLWDGRWFIAGFFVLAVIFSLLVSLFVISPVYETEAVLELGNTGGTYGNADTVAELLNGKILEDTLDEIKVGFPDRDLFGATDKFTVEKVKGTGILKLKVSYQNPELSYILTEKIISRLKDLSDSHYREVLALEEKHLEEIQKEMKNIDLELAKIDEELGNIQKSNLKPVEKSIVSSGLVDKRENLVDLKYQLMNKKHDLTKKIQEYNSLQILKMPVKPENPVSPKIKLNLAIGGVLGLMLGVFVVFMMDFLKEGLESDRKYSI